MENFWTFHQDLGNINNAFKVLSISHFLYLFLAMISIYFIIRKYSKCTYANKIRWQRGMGYFFVVEEMMYYSWILIHCQENLIFEFISLELCSICSLVNISTLFHQNKQVRFFSACMGLLGGTLAMLYPINVANVYPFFSYRILSFFITHSAYIILALMFIQDYELIRVKRLLINMGICAGMIVTIYFINLAFDTHYMFVGTPPEIGIIRIVYDIVGNLAFLPVVLLVFSAIQALVYSILKWFQQYIYPTYEVNAIKLGCLSKVK